MTEAEAARDLYDQGKVNAFIVEASELARERGLNVWEIEEACRSLWKAAAGLIGRRAREVADYRGSRPTTPPRTER